MDCLQTVDTRDHVGNRTRSEPDAGVISDYIRRYMLINSFVDRCELMKSVNEVSDLIRGSVSSCGDNCHHDNHRVFESDTIAKLASSAEQSPSYSSSSARHSCCGSKQCDSRRNGR